MRLYTLIGCLTYFLCPISAYDPFEGLFKQGRPCFKVANTPTCFKTLAESYEPQSPKLGSNEPTTSVYLFTPRNPNIAEPLHLCGGKLPPASTYDPNADTEVFIHGWLDGVCRTAWMREMKEQLFLQGKYNVILVDWTWGNTFDHLLASANSKIVGEQVGFVINNIMGQTGVSPEKFHVVGHSFGAIASGFVGRKVNGLIRRITALDPAVAPFLEAPPNDRITYRDAKIVDVIHSNAGSCYAVAVGDARQLGHADFYPNGGTIQPSCVPYIFTSILKKDILYAFGSLEPRICNHLQSIQYYKMSINPKGCQFVGVESSSYEDFLREAHSSGNQTWAVMGMDYELYHPKNDVERRIYFLKTALHCPYYDDSYLGEKEFPFKTQCTASNA